MKDFSNLLNTLNNKERNIKIFLKEKPRKKCELCHRVTVGVKKKYCSKCGSHKNIYTDFYWLTDKRRTNLLSDKPLQIP